MEKIKDRLHILDGLLIAYLNLDDVIKTIRESDHPKKDLMLAFLLTDIQATAILEIKLRQLAKLEEIKLKSETKLNTPMTYVKLTENREPNQFCSLGTK